MCFQKPGRNLENLEKKIEKVLKKRVPTLCLKLRRKISLSRTSIEFTETMA